MNDFKITSKFVGILLDQNLFVNLFARLKNYLDKNDLIDKVILSNTNSIHLTLYYLDAELSLEENKRLQFLIDELRKDFKSLELNVTSFNYFYDQEKERIAYFETNNAEKLEKINQIFRLSFPNKVLDNQYNFIPHVTLFRVVDPASFKKHKENLEKIFISYIDEIKGKNLFKSIHIFEVDSTKQPEQQRVVN